MKKISNAELEVMKIIWKEKTTTSKQIIEQVKKFNWNDSTVRTLIHRLIVKKAISISEKHGREYTFFPLIDEEKYKLEAKKEFLQKFFDGSAFKFLKFFMDNDKEYDQEICNFLKNHKKTKD